MFACQCRLTHRSRNKVSGPCVPPVVRTTVYRDGTDRQPSQPQAPTTMPKCFSSRTAPSARTLFDAWVLILFRPSQKNLRRPNTVVSQDHKNIKAGSAPTDDERFMATDQDELAENLFDRRCVPNKGTLGAGGCLKRSPDQI